MAARDAVRRATVRVELDGQIVSLVSSTYRLPMTVGKVQIDCAVTKGYTINSSKENAWGMVKDARLRLWPANSNLIRPGTFVYPVKQRWFASDTQMANVPTFVDGGEIPSNKNIYFYAEDSADGVTWNTTRYSGRQLLLPNATETQVSVNASRYYAAGTRLRFYVWGDATVTLNTTDLAGTTPGAVTKPAYRFLIA